MAPDPMGPGGKDIMRTLRPTDYVLTGLLTAVADYKLTGWKEARIRGLHAATILAGRYNVNGKYIFMADIWRPKHPSDARYVWLPIEFESGKPIIEWHDSWSLSDLKK